MPAKTSESLDRPEVFSTDLAQIDAQEFGLFDVANVLRRLSFAKINVAKSVFCFLPLNRKNLFRIYSCPQKLMLSLR